MNSKKGVLLYYSATGNTKATSDALVKQIGGMQFDMVDAGNSTAPDLSEYAVIGFAAPVFHLGLHPVMEEAIGNLPRSGGQSAFLLLTFGMMAGRAPVRLEKAVSERGFIVTAWHSLHCPESFPPFIAKGWGSEDSPGTEEVTAFSSFCSEVEALTADAVRSRTPASLKVRIDLLSRLIPAGSIKAAVRKAGVFSADESICTRCGTCVSGCSRAAVKMDGFPAFESALCIGCFRCYNRCSSGALRTTALSGDFRYRGPSARLIDL